MFKDISKLLKVLGVVCVIAGVSAYAFFNTRIFIQGPKIIVHTPDSGASSDEKVTQIEGVVLNSSFISINNRPIFIDENGNFSEQILLYPGYNIIVIEARDKFARQVTRQLDLVYNSREDEFLSRF